CRGSSVLPHVRILNVYDEGAGEDLCAIRIYEVRRIMDGVDGHQDHEGDPMKVVALGEAKNSLSAYVDDAQHDRVLVTRHGKPAALIIGVEGEDFEDLMTRSDPKFWNMIEARRKASKTLSADEMRKRVGVAEKPRRKRKRAE